MTYYENTPNTYIPSSFHLESRMRAIATNAVRETTRALGRGDYPYTDNDAAIIENIFNLLRNLWPQESITREAEHQALAIPKGTPTFTQAQIAEMLDHWDDQIRTANVASSTTKSNSAED